MVRRLLLPLGLLCLMVLQVQGQATAVRSRVLVKLKPTVTNVQFLTDFSTNSRSSGGAWIEKSLSQANNIILMKYDSSAIGSDDFLKELTQNQNVESATFDYEIQTRSGPIDPNDPNFDEQWGLSAIKADKAWELTTGGLTARGDTIVVAILDSGFDINHEDLAANVWYNRSEIKGDGKDNDANGYIDDYSGWNFPTNSPNHKADVHGQSVAGIVGAKGNNGIGVTGINWNVKLMLFEAKLVSEIISAYEYIIDQRNRYNKSKGKEGAFVVSTNASFGINRIFCKDQPLWGGMYDRLGDVGILTAAGAANNAWDLDEVGDMPTSCESKFLITVLNTNDQDQKYAGSGYGKKSIDMGAPGQNSFTTRPANAYGSFNGNSASAPHLAGSIALLYSLPCKGFATRAIDYPMQTAMRVRQALLQGVDLVPALSDYTETGGRLNVYESLVNLNKDCPAEPIVQSVSESSMLLYPNPANEMVELKFMNEDHSEYEIAVYSLLGLVMYRKRNTPAFTGTQQEEIMVKGWSPGTYFVQVFNGKEKMTNRLVVW